MSALVHRFIGQLYVTPSGLTAHGTHLYHVQLTIYLVQFSMYTVDVHKVEESIIVVYSFAVLCCTVDYMFKEFMRVKHQSPARQKFLFSKDLDIRNSTHKKGLVLNLH